MGPIIPILVAVAILIFAVILYSRSKASSEASGTQQDELFNHLVAEGYTRKDASHCIRFDKRLGKDIRIEIEWSLMNKKEPRLDIDIYKDGFSINLPEDVTTAFFEYVVFQNYNKVLQETNGMELLSDQGGDYFQRANFKKMPSPVELQAQIDAQIELYENFPYHNEEDFKRPLFQAIIQEGYQIQRGAEQMVFRFSKAIDDNHLSLYYVKAMDMLFFACSPLTDAAIQEDFRDDQTLLHHFNKTPALAKETEEEAFQFPTFEEFKGIEAEFLGLEEETSEEEE